MAKSRKNRKSVLKTITHTTEQALPMVDKGLQNVGTVAKGVVVTAAPIVEKGVSKVYGTMATGFDLGVKGVNTVAKGITKKSKTRKQKTYRRRHKGRKSNRRH
jgi:transposase